MSLIAGVLNVTPDSFHDGGKFTDVSAALTQVEAMLAAGADLIDIGGESTGPGSSDVSLEEERRRVIPVVEVVMDKFPQTKISVDTYKAQIARDAIAAGAAMINDVTAGRGDPQMFSVVARSNAELVLMYGKDPTARTTIADAQYEDVVATVSAFLAERRDAAIAAGIPRERILLDPGLGHFISSDARYSLELIARLPELRTLGCRIFLSPSRKSFVAGSEKLKTVDRLPGTIAASAIAALNGADIIRTHDVLEVRRACEIAEDIRKRMR